MRIVDDRNRLFGLVNPVDLVVAAVLVAAALVLLNVLFGIFDSEAADLVDVEFDITALGVRDFERGQVEVGDDVYSAVAGRLGVVVAVEAYPSQVELIAESGQAVVVESALLTDVRMTVRGRGSVDPLGYLVGGVRIQNNGRIDIVTRGLEAERAFISSVQAVEN